MLGMMPFWKITSSLSLFAEIHQTCYGQEAASPKGI
jgi:hypothetical protein